MNQNKPIQYQKGWVEFYKLKFKVTPDVLIPRPETEALVEEVLAYANGLLQTAYGQKKNTTSSQPQAISILDIGTGAGGIAISLAKNLNLHLKGVGIKIIATDISQKALEVAKKNAKFHQLKGKIEFIESDLLEKLPPRRWDVVVTNLPYIPSARIPFLDSSVKDFEPLISLDGGEDGFAVYRKLFKQIRLQPKLLLGEIDYTHGELAIYEAQKFFPTAQIEVKTDLHRKLRMLKILW